MNRFIDYFFGTPQRLLTTIIILTIIWGVFNLDKLVQLLNNLLAVAVNNILPLAIVIGLIVYGFRRLINGK